MNIEDEHKCVPIIASINAIEDDREKAIAALIDNLAADGIELRYDWYDGFHKVNFGDGWVYL